MPPDGPLWIERVPGDVWLEHDDNELRVGFISDGAHVTHTPDVARTLAHEIERILWNQNHYWELARSLLRAADDAEALDGIDVS